MATITALDPQVTLFREDIMGRLTSAVSNLTSLQYGRETAERDRLERKTEAVRKVINDQGLRLVQVKSKADIIILASIITMTAQKDGADKPGTELVIGYMSEYLR